jgi:hypothetical protein
MSIGQVVFGMFHPLQKYVVPNANNLKYELGKILRTKQFGWKRDIEKGFHVEWP